MSDFQSFSSNSVKKLCLAFKRHVLYPSSFDVTLYDDSQTPVALRKHPENIQKKRDGERWTEGRSEGRRRYDCDRWNGRREKGRSGVTDGEK